MNDHDVETCSCAICSKARVFDAEFHRFNAAMQAVDTANMSDKIHKIQAIFEDWRLFTETYKSLSEIEHDLNPACDCVTCTDVAQIRAQYA